MNRLKSTQLPPLPAQGVLAAGSEPPTEPGIWTKLLPDGRTVPWIVLAPVEPNDATGLTAETASRTSRGCYKCTS